MRVKYYWKHLLVFMLFLGMTFLGLRESAWSASKFFPQKSHYISPYVGYLNGIGGGLKYSFVNISPGIPLGLHLSFGYFHQQDSGDATSARHIFINDNEGGKIEKYGINWLVAFDLSYTVERFRSSEIRLYAGPRYMSYKGHYAYIGDNEEFDVVSTPWGIGGGLLFQFAISRSFCLFVNVGLDYYYLNKLEGHGKYHYTPDGVDENPRTNNDGYTYTYEDADKAVNQPGWEGKFFIGIAYRLAP